MFAKLTKYWNRLSTRQKVKLGWTTSMTAWIVYALWSWVSGLDSMLAIAPELTQEETAELVVLALWGVTAIMLLLVYNWVTKAVNGIVDRVWADGDAQ